MPVGGEGGNKDSVPLSISKAQKKGEASEILPQIHVGKHYRFVEAKTNTHVTGVARSLMRDVFLKTSVPGVIQLLLKNI